MRAAHTSIANLSFPLPLPLALALAVSLGLAPGCTCGGGRSLPVEAGRDFGDTAAPPPDAAQAASYLAMARAIVEHKGRTGAPAPPPGTGRRILLAYYHPGVDPLVTTSSGATLADAVAAAAEALAGSAGDPRGGAPRARRPQQPGPGDRAGGRGAAARLHRPRGVLVTGDDGKTGAVLPAEIVQRRLGREGNNGLSHARLAPLLASRAGVAATSLATMRAYRFRTAAFVESASHDGARAVFRGMVERPADATPQRLLAAVRHGADYLARVMSPEGHYSYLYHPIEDRDEPVYGWLRHAGTTYALLEAYEEFGTPVYVQKGELALRYLKAHLRDDPASQGKFVLDTTDEEQQKVGGAGISLVAFAKHAAVTGSREELETMRALARFIMKSQYEDGHFRANVDLEHETGKKLKREVVYYQGEAVLGLMRLYALDPQQQYLDAARRGADWVVRVRDADVSEDNQEHDHWLSYAMNDLFRVTHDRTYVDFAYKVARAIEKKQRPAEGAPAPDLVGTFYNGATTPAATRLEAYDADMALARFAGEPIDWIEGPAREVARSTLGQQFDPDNAYWLKNPSKVEGGVRESLFVPDVRIDYVQHAMSAWLHLARLLRDPAYGKSGIPSQDPVKPPVP